MNTIDDTRPTVGERYTSAMESSNLRAQAEKRGDVDLMIAAGWAPDTLGVTLYRLAAEFDNVRRHLSLGKSLNQIERFLILAKLKTLPRARAEPGAWACKEATFQKYYQPDTEVVKLVGRVLDVHLDSKCHACEGRGFNGGGRHENSGPMQMCRGCRGTGDRKVTLGKDQAEIDFTRHLLAQMSQRMDSVEQMMKRFLRSHE